MREFLSNIDQTLLLEAVKYGLMFILGLVSWYYKSNTKLQNLAGKYIAAAEVLYQDNEQRLDWVVAQLYRWVPMGLRPFLTKSQVKYIIQSVFDGSKAYRQAWKDSLDKVVDTIPEPKMREEPREW